MSRTTPGRAGPKNYSVGDRGESSSAIPAGIKPNKTPFITVTLHVSYVGLFIIEN